MKKIAIVLIIGLIALAFVIPASAAGNGGDGCGCGYGKMYQNAGAQTLQNASCPNPDCPREDCTGNQIPPRDGTGFKYSKGGFGKNRV